MIFIFFYFFASLQLFSSYQSLKSGLKYLRFFRDELGRPPGGPFPPASVIVPCRGLDQDLEQNLLAILSQDYPEYETVFSVGSREDPALLVIRRVADRCKGSVKIVVAGEASGRGQKVHNLIEASKAVSKNSEILVFADSDARPSAGWLSELASGLADAGSGCATGYRWFLPKEGGFGGHVRSVWNASIASALGPDTRSNFCWGGSTAIRRNDFERLDVRKAWSGAAADDFSLTRLIRTDGGLVRFVPACLTPSIEDCSVGELLEFTTRQMKITRVYSPDLWMFSLLGSGLYCATMIFAMAILAFTSGANFAIAAVFVALVIVMGTLKAALRMKAVSLALGDYQDELKRQLPWQLTLWTLTPLLFLYNCLVALVSRRIVWRGIGYELESAERTRIISRNG